MRRSLRSVAIAATVALSLLAETAVVTSAGLAASAADQLPRAYQVDALAEVPEHQFYGGPLALSADGNTALHLSTNHVLVASPNGEVVGVGLDGQPFPPVVDAAISADARKAAFVARGADAADLGLPPEADPGTPARRSSSATGSWTSPRGCPSPTRTRTCDPDLDRPHRGRLRHRDVRRRGRPGGNAAPPVSATYTVAYVFTGFAAPVRGDVVNTAKGGQGMAIRGVGKTRATRYTRLSPPAQCRCSDGGEGSFPIVGHR